MKYTSPHNAKIDQVLEMSSNSSDELDLEGTEGTGELILNFKLHIS